MGDTDNISVILCTEGLIMPCWYPLENVSGIEKAFRGLLYFLFMVWLFIGVAIVCDQFMAAIEKITSQEREVSVRKSNGEKQIVVVKIWNETVANLTLMALGSSAPEILLSIIEIYAKNYEAGELGPGTIVGSAAYNLFVIIAICVVVIPKGEVKRIKHLDVFFVTTAWSIFAYIWMYLIISGFSPGEVEIWEGLLTLFFFFATVFTAYAADRKMYKNKKLGKFYTMNRRGTIVESEAADNLEMEKAKPLLLNDVHDVHDDLKEEYINTLKELRQRHPHTDIQVLENMAQELLLANGHKSRAFYRIQGTRKLIGSDLMRKKVQSDLTEIKTELPEENNDNNFKQMDSKVFFAPSTYIVLENCGTFEVRVVRTGNIHTPLSVKYTTEDGTAQVGNDYVKAEGTLYFNPGEIDKRITVEIIDDDVFELDQHFYVKLSSTKPVDCLGAPMLATVIVLDDDHGGLFKFETQDHELVESIGTYELKVIRRTGVKGRVIIPYYTEDGTAKSGKDYEVEHGELVFENDESEKVISLSIIEEDSYEKDVLFYVQLGEPQMSGDEVASLAAEAEKKRPEDRTERERIAIMGRPRLGDITRAQIRIKESKEFKNTVDKLVQRANASLLIGTSSWKEQFVEALTVSSSDEDDQKEPSKLDYFMHCLTVFWKVLFAFVPPTDLCKGYLCFVVSIFCIGVVTAVIGDVASHFGATLGIKDGVTAIVFVALGTSIPDTFASKVAAIHDKHADASVGNVTGSNAVNVFLGIGVAWSIAAIYHGAHGRKFKVDPGSLAFSVTIFCTEAAIVICILLLRRSKVIGGELGGPECLKYLTSSVLFGLWIIYLVVSTLEAYGVIHGF